jgi:hypothetical protein
MLLAYILFYSRHIVPTFIDSNNRTKSVADADPDSGNSVITTRSGGEVRVENGGADDDDGWKRREKRRGAYI